jgi:hypothetical protein
MRMYVTTYVIEALDFDFILIKMSDYEALLLDPFR